MHSILFFVVQLDFSEPSNNGFIVEKSWFLFSLGNDLKGFKIEKKIEKLHFKVIIRVILAPNDLLTRFDLRAKNFRVNVKLSVHYRGHKFFSKKCPKVTFWLEKNFISFLKNWLDLGGHMGIKGLGLDHWWPENIKNWAPNNNKTIKFDPFFHNQVVSTVSHHLCKNN